MRLRRHLSGSALLCVAIIGGILAVNGRSPFTHRTMLLSSSQFTISSPTVGPVLYPGAAPANFPLTATNNLNVPITVTSITVSITGTLPVGCPAGNFKLNGTSFAGTTPQVTLSGLSLTVAGGTSSTASVTPTPTLQLMDNNLSQNACENATLAFTYSGSARYTVVTNTALVASPTSSVAGQSVTLTATVSSNSTGAPTTPGPPVGSVSFLRCTNPSCTTFNTLASGVVVNGSGVATTSTSFSATGSYQLKATFTPTDATNFMPSTSTTVTETVNAASIATSTALTATPNPSTAGQPVAFKATVTSGSGTPSGQVTFFDGSTSLGTVNLTGGQATLNLSTLSVGSHPITAQYLGNASYMTSTSQVVTQVVYTSCVTGTVGGGLTVASGQSICISSSGRVNGNVTVQGGGSLAVLGGTVNGVVTVQASGALTVNGGSVNGITSNSATAVTVCSASVKGDVSVSGTSGAVLMGCGANDISGNVNITGNSGGFEIISNTIAKALTVTNNVASVPSPKATIKGNQVKGSLGCSGNIPPPTNGGATNTVKGSKTGQCAGTGF